MKHSCTFCAQEAVIRIPHRGLKLCKEHFINYVQTEVENTISRFSMLDNVRKLLVTVSGGKDSAVLLHVLKEVCDRKKVKILALTIDLGISNYSEECVRKASELCKQLGVDHIIVKLSDYGFTIDDVKKFEKKLRRPVCSVCGLVKRYLFNKIAIEEQCDAIATGHNMVDICQYILMNILNGNIEYLTKLTPVTEGEEGLIKRIRPLYFIHEKETRLYAEILKLPVVDRACPYSERGTFSTRKSKQPLQEYVRAFLMELDEKYPGTLYYFVENFLRKTLPSINVRQSQQFRRCKICGLPTTRDSEICAFCHIVDIVRGLKSGTQHDTCGKAGT